MYTEIEVKFYVKNLNKMAVKLEELGATLESPRTHEMNLRFDTPTGTLSAKACVLRLRQDAQSKLTLKDASQVTDGVLSREEIEFTVGDFDAAQRFLEALGYQRVATYEKYRTIYRLDGLEIVLDEMPYGNFLEIEGEDGTAILASAEKLSLNADLAVKLSYLEVFQSLCEGTDIDFSQLTFHALENVQLDLGKINVHCADN